MNEDAFLQTYNPKDYPAVLVTVDTVLLTWHQECIQILLVKRDNHPEKDKWGLPGGFLDQTQDASLRAAASRSVQQKTGVLPAYLEQIGATGSADRDPRGWSVSVIFSALMPYEASTAHVDSVSDVAWVPVAQLNTLTIAFDHRQAIDQAVARYRQKALYSFVPVFALQPPFTITQLRKVHEALIGQLIQRKSFSRRVEASGMLSDTGEVQIERGRPAALYKANSSIADYRFIRNIEVDD